MRRRRRVLPRRSAREWGVRAGLALAAAAVGSWSVMQSLAYSERGAAPEVAHKLAPGDGRITAILSEELSGPEATPTDRARADELAKLALRQDPTAVTAAATLGINAQIRGDTAGARRIFAYAQTLSRRDLRTQLWAIEDAVSRGDISAALKQYDITLRTSEYGPDLLFPVLGSAISSPAIREALIETLAAKPAWTQAFIEYLVGSDADPRSVRGLFVGLRHKRVPISDNAQAGLIISLMKQDLKNEAWDYYRSLHPAADRRKSRDDRFSSSLGTPTPFDWEPIENDGLRASIQRANNGGVVDFSAPADIGGVILRQIQLLPPGVYILRGHSANINQPEGSRPYWSLVCDDGKEIGRIDVPNSDQRNGNFEGRFVVPEGCGMQSLQMTVRPSDAVGGVVGQIDRAQLIPTR